MKRNIGIDALKVLSMFMIVVLHILGQGGVLETLPQFCIRYNIAWFIEIICLCSVNCFALATGYLNYGKKYNFKSLISLWFQVIFYTLLLTMVIKFFYPEQINYGYIGKMLFPTMGHSYWYFTAYVGLYLFMPLLNFLLEKADKKLLGNSLLLILGFTTIGNTLNGNFLFENSGYSTIWLVVMYLVGGMVKKYNISAKNKNKCLYNFFLYGAINFALKLIVDKFFIDIPFVNNMNYTLCNYTSVFLVIASINLFLYFESFEPKNIKIKNAIKILAPVSFGVYLVHTNPAVWMTLMNKTFIWIADRNSLMFVFCLCTASVCLFITCSIIDFGRLRLFKSLKIDKLSERISCIIQNKFLS